MLAGMYEGFVEVTGSTVVVMTSSFSDYCLTVSSKQHTYTHQYYNNEWNNYYYNDTR